MPNPFGELAKLTVGKVVADSWTATMLSLWQAAQEAKAAAFGEKFVPRCSV